MGYNLPSMADKQYTLGIDIGGTKILAAVFNKRFELLAEVKTKTRTDKGDGHFLKSLREVVDHALQDAGVKRSEVIAVGAGCPGFVDEARGVVGVSPNIPFLKSYPLAKRLSDLLNVPVVLGNDVQTGLYGEFSFGAARGYKHVLGIFMGTGIGGALIFNGQLYRGASGSAGEIGHVQYDPLGPMCGCGRRGCFEAYAGRLAIAAEAAVLVARGKAPHLAEETGTDIRAIKSGALAKAIQAGDRAVEDLMRQKARIVGVMMANMTNLLSPELIVLGGGVVEAMPSLITREAERTMREQAIGPSAARVRVVAAKLGDHSIVMGAARRAADRFTDRRRGDRRDKKKK
jgi:glucokinase